MELTLKEKICVISNSCKTLENGFLKSFDYGKFYRETMHLLETIEED